MIKILDPSALRLHTSLSKSEHGTAWGVFRDPANGFYLLTERSPTSNNAGQWGFTGGGVDDGESHVVALRRETKEEILVDVPLSAFKPIISETETNTTWFEAFLKVKPKKTAEVSNFAWVPFYDLEDYNLHKSVRNYFKMMHKHIK